MDRGVCFKINKPKVIYESFEDEQIIVNLDTGNYYSLDRVAADIWNFIERRLTLSEIVESISHRYTATSRLEIETKIGDFLETLKQEALIVAEETKEGASAKIDISPDLKKKEFCPPTLQKYSDMQQLLILDPIHEVDETGWPVKKQELFK